MTNSASSASSPNSDLLAPLPSDAFVTSVRVRYSETDRMGVAHNKVYYEWFELARTEYCRDRGLTYREIEERGVFLVVAESHCLYRRPVRYDEIVLVRTVLSRISARKAVFAYELTTGDGSDLVARGYTVHVAVDREGRVSSLPPDVLERIGGNSAAAG